MNKYSKDWYQNRLRNRQDSRKSPSGSYYWIFIQRDAKSAYKWVCCGYELDEGTAMQRAYEYANGREYKIHECSSKSKPTAIASFKGAIFSEDHDLDSALARIKHKEDD